MCSTDIALGGNGGPARGRKWMGRAEEGGLVEVGETFLIEKGWDACPRQEGPHTAASMSFLLWALPLPWGKWASSDGGGQGMPPPYPRPTPGSLSLGWQQVGGACNSHSKASEEVLVHFLDASCAVSLGSPGSGE